MIAQILQLAQVGEIDPGREHYPLTSSVQAPVNPRLDNIEKKLADALMGVDEPEVELKLPGDGNCGKKARYLSPNFDADDADKVDAVGLQCLFDKIHSIRRNRHLTLALCSFNRDDG